jgi:ATP-binding cassette, subfamily B, bacterial
MWNTGWWSYISSTGEKPKVTWSLMRRVLNYSQPYRWQIIAMLLMILFNTGLTLITPLIMRDLIDRTIPARDLNRLVWLALALLLIPALGGFVNVFQRRLNSYVGEGVIYDLRVALFSRLQRMSLRFFTNTKTGELMSRLNNDVVGAQNAISNTLVGIITNIIQAVAVLGVMLTLEWHLTLISVIILPLFILVARRLGGRLRDISREQMEANARMNAMMNETLNIGGALLVKLFGRTRVEIERFQDRSARVRDLGIFRAVTGTAFFVIIGLISAVGTALVYGLGGYFVIRDIFTIGTIVAFGAYLSSLYGSLQGLANAPVEFATSMVSFERVFEVIDLPLEIAEKPDAVDLPVSRGELVFEEVTFRYAVKQEFLLRQVDRPGRMENVQAVLSDSRKPPAALPIKKAPGNGAAKVFTTPQKNGAPAADNTLLHRSPPADDEPVWNGDGERAAEASSLLDLTEEGALGEEQMPQSQAREIALQSISFHAAEGQLVALVGPSGAGKTTMTYLIPRLYDPTEGRILIDGIDLRDVSLESLTRQIGMVTQETYLFHDTIRTNLLYARLDATQPEIEAAARAANIHEFIAGLPEGYDTVVGERGYRLSGGEKQRIALARVILKDPRILVLDEATSHLDSESEVLIQEALKRVMAGRTSIVIAHRLSTILAADQILVMNRGRITESGTHAELLTLGGLYAQLYHTQFSREK